MALCIYRVEVHSWGNAQIHHGTISKRIQNKHRNWIHLFLNKNWIHLGLHLKCTHQTIRRAHTGQSSACILRPWLVWMRTYALCFFFGKAAGLFAWTYQPAYQLESTVFFSHNKLVSAGLSADFNTSRTFVQWTHATTSRLVPARFNGVYPARSI